MSVHPEMQLGLLVGQYVLIQAAIRHDGQTRVAKGADDG